MCSWEIMIIHGEVFSPSLSGVTRAAGDLIGATTSQCIGGLLFFGMSYDIHVCRIILYSQILSGEREATAIYLFANESLLGRPSPFWKNLNSSS